MVFFRKNGYSHLEGKQVLIPIQTPQRHKEKPVDAAIILFQQVVSCKISMFHIKCDVITIHLPVKNTNLLRPVKDLCLKV
jgi:hypothetical protein